MWRVRPHRPRVVVGHRDDVQGDARAGELLQELHGCELTGAGHTVNAVNDEVGDVVRRHRAEKVVQFGALHLGLGVGFGLDARLVYPHAGGAGVVPACLFLIF